MATGSQLAVVTAAGGGIGRAVVRRLLARGLGVVAVDRDASALERLVAESPSGSLHTLTADMTSDADVQVVFQKTAALGNLHILVNGVGSTCDGGLRDLSLQQWQQTFDLNLTSVFLSMRAALPLLEAASGDRVVINISSTLATVADPDTLAYGAVKAALEQFTRAAALDLASSGIRVVCVAPGPVAGTAGEANYEDADFARLNPLGRFATGDEIAGAIAYLASPEAAYITGVILRVDGGDAALGAGWGMLQRLQSPGSR